MSEQTGTEKKNGKKTLRLGIDLLKGDPDNARRIGGGALLGLQASMETFGDLSGIVWNEKTGELVAGHQRMRGLREEGAMTWTREGETGWIEHPKTGERFPIRIVDWDETMQRMANLTANNPAIQGDFTDEVKEQLRELEGQEQFTTIGLAEMQKALDEDLKKAAAEDSGEGAGDQTGELEQKFAIVIECSSEGQQREMLDRFMGEGLACRALI